MAARHALSKNRVPAAMKPRPLSVLLRFCLAGFAAAGLAAVGVAVARHPVQPDIPAAARQASRSASPSPAMPKPRPAAPGESESAAAEFLDLKSRCTGEADRYRCGLFFRQWADRDFAAALACADRQPAGPWREDMFGWLALVVARLSPAEAATMADRDMKPGSVRNETAIAILHQWARTDLARAAAWADSFPRGPFRDRALDEVAGFMSDVPPARSPN